MYHFMDCQQERAKVSIFEEFDDQTEWFLYSDAAKLSIFDAYL